MYSALSHEFIDSALHATTTLITSGRFYFTRIFLGNTNCLSHIVYIIIIVFTVCGYN